MSVCIAGRVSIENFRTPRKDSSFPAQTMVIVAGNVICVNFSANKAHQEKHLRHHPEGRREKDPVTEQCGGEAGVPILALGNVLRHEDGEVGREDADDDV